MTMMHRRRTPLNFRLTTLAALTACLATLTACDPSERAEAESERESRAYQSASADYKAGRIDAATKGFAKAVREDPANAEARFQLACLLHDSAKDPAGAFCAYREYLLQRPSGDKAALASRRLEMCERELAAALAAKHKLVTGTPDAEAIDKLRGEVKAYKAKVAKLQGELEDASRKIAALAEDKKRLVGAMKGDEETTVAQRPSVKEIQDLLDDDEGEGAPSVADEAAALRREESVEAALGSSLLAQRSSSETAALKKAAEDKSAKPKQPVRPETYEVQEGDTLYKIATRFYGTIHAWRKIRDANKAYISTDGRVKAGDTIRLP